MNLNIGQNYFSYFLSMQETKSIALYSVNFDHRIIKWIQITVLACHQKVNVCINTIDTTELSPELQQLEEILCCPLLVRRHGHLPEL